MPDITSARPVAGAPVASAWGGEVHDQLEGIQVGQVNVVLSAAANGNTAVTFARPFLTTPRIVVSMANAPGGSQRFVPRHSGATATGFTAYIYTADQSAQTATVAVDWIAVGTPA